MSLRVVLLGGCSQSSRMVFHALQCEFGVCAAVIEDPVPRSKFLLRRIKRLGWKRVAGQVLLTQFVVPILSKEAKSRAASIKRTYALNDSAIPKDKSIRVSSVNSDQCIEALQAAAPDIVAVAGTRVIAERVLASVKTKFINIHAGITPLYRGVHGGYWSLVHNDLNNCGVTVHLVDKGIDTGGIVHQALIQPLSADNFTTYPLLQLGEGIRLLKLTIHELEGGRFALKPAPYGPSRLWSHPTLSEYCGNRNRAGVK
jgi:folate-dependent phosphoribosylglycinamide formyltransferase PurN